MRRTALLTALLVTLTAWYWQRVRAPGGRGPRSTGSLAASLRPEPPPGWGPDLAFRTVVEDLSQPLAVATLPGDPRRRWLVAEKTGTVRVVEAGQAAPEPVLDLRGRVSRGGEQGLLGLAVHPRFAQNGRVFVDYTDVRGDTRLVEYRVDPATLGPVEPDAGRSWLTLDQPYSNHNGGHLAFGPDGWLWVGTGDGGAGGDPVKNGQNPETLLGKILRLDVERPSATPEMALLGLRNPWRYSFDRETGDLYLGDVGQNRYEEVDVVPRGSGLLNLGWAVMEGARCHPQDDLTSCDPTRFHGPLAVYDHHSGCSVTGGVVYRGSRIPVFRGVYFYADFCQPRLWGVRWTPAQAGRPVEWRPVDERGRPIEQIASFGEDEAGEMLLISLRGSLYRLDPGPTPNPGAPR